MRGMNIELTTKCPLHCPQCYCTLEGGKDIPIEIAKQKLYEAKGHGVEVVNLSGGETLCYPNLCELISYAKKLDIKANVALSGWNFTEEVFKKIVKSGVFGIFISLNGSTEEINSLTRKGYQYAINALNILKKYNYKNSVINWVMTSENCTDFMNMVKIAEEYNISNLVILMLKPDSRNELKHFPNSQQIIKIAKEIRKYNGKVNIVIESCFSQLLAIYKDYGICGNLNTGPSRGCRAALQNYSVSVDGKYSPCRHLDFLEDFQNLDDYLNQSKIVKKIMQVDNNKKLPCSICYYRDHCKPCLAINSKLNNDIYIGHNICKLWQKKDID